MSWDFLRVPLPFPERKVHQPGVNVDMGPSRVIQGAPQLPDPSSPLALGEQGLFGVSGRGV